MDLPVLTPTSSVYSEHSQKTPSGQHVPLLANPYAESLWYYARGDYGDEIKKLQVAPPVQDVGTETLKEAIAEILIHEKHHSQDLLSAIDSHATLQMTHKQSVLLFGSLSTLRELSENFVLSMVSELRTGDLSEVPTPRTKGQVELPSDAALRRLVAQCNILHTDYSSRFQLYTSRLTGCLGSYVATQNTRLEESRLVCDENALDYNKFAEIFKMPIARSKQLATEIESVRGVSDQSTTLDQCLSDLRIEPPLPALPPREKIYHNEQFRAFYQHTKPELYAQLAKNPRCDELFMLLELKHKFTQLGQLEKAVARCFQSMKRMSQLLVRVASDYNINTGDAHSVMLRVSCSTPRSHRRQSSFVASPCTEYLSKASRQQEEATTMLKLEYGALITAIQGAISWSKGVRHELNRRPEGRHKVENVIRLLDAFAERVYADNYRIFTQYVEIMAGPKIVSAEQIVELFRESVGLNRKALLSQDPVIEYSMCFTRLFRQ